LEANELIHPYCAVCGNSPHEKETEHFFFKLSQFSQKLKQWILENKQWPHNARNFSLGWISEGLQDRAITRDLSWGIPVPLKGYEGKVLYVWFEAPIGYISATKEWAVEEVHKPKEWEKYWKDGKTKIVHFIGKDNIPFHAVIWPAILMAYGEGINLPWQISSNEHLTLEGKKMSTSKGWVLWLHHCLENFNADLLRYYLLSINPEKHDADFSLKEFQSRVNEELISTLGNFIHRVLSFIQEKNNGIIPQPVEKDYYDEEDNKIISGIDNARKEIGNHIENFRFKNALLSLMNLASLGNQYFQQKEPWRKDKGNRNTLLLCANLVRSLSILMFPFLPFSAEKTWSMLNLKGSVSEQEWNSASELRIKPNHKISEHITRLFKHIEDSEIEKFEKKFLKTRKEREEEKTFGEEKKMEEKKEKKDEVEFSDFEKLDLRIGKIKAIEEHPKADKLYILKVDVGDLGERTLVAGIKEFYSKDELIGKNILVVTNLKPKKIKGIKSEGMLLAAEVDGKAILLTLDKEVKAGSKVR
jgi:methionyl-tRNA synthetase